MSVFLNRVAARRGEIAKYDIVFSITDKPMKVVRAERGETSFIIDVKVEGVPNLWRCYHDGTQCTGTEYQGEG